MAAMDERHERAMQQHDREIQQSREQFDRKMQQRREQLDREMQQSRERFDREMQLGSQRHDREMHQIREQLRRGVRLAVQDARSERKRRREMAEQWDQKITQLSAAQLVTEEKLQGLLESMRRSNNGHS